MIEARRLYGLGIGLTDAHLIASVFLNSPILLWTRDKQLRKAAEALGIHASLVEKRRRSFCDWEVSIVQSPNHPIAQFQIHFGFAGSASCLSHPASMDSYLPGQWDLR